MAQLLEVVQDHVSERVGYQVKLKHEDFTIKGYVYGFNNEVNAKVFPNVWEFEFDDWNVQELYIGNTELRTDQEGWVQIEKLFGKDRKFFDNLVEEATDKIKQPEGRNTLNDVSDIDIFKGLDKMLKTAKTFEKDGKVYVQSFYSMYIFLKNLSDRGYIIPQKVEIVKPGNSYKSSCLEFNEVEDFINPILNKY